MYPLGRVPVFPLSLALAFLWTPVEKAVGHGVPRISIDQARQLREEGHDLTRMIICNRKFRSRTTEVVFSGCPIYQLDGTDLEIEKLMLDFEAMGQKFDVALACSQ